MFTRDIERYRSEVEADPTSLKFAPLADLLRRAGDLDGAQQVLETGFRVHPGLRSARLVQARVMRDRGQGKQALALVGELYPEDSGNVALTELYCELLVDARELDQVEEVLRRSASAGIPDEVLNRVEAALEAVREPVSDDDEEDGLDSLGGVLTLPGLYLEELGDPFAVPVVAARVARAGHRNQAKAIWREVSQHHPAFITRANREIARLSGIAGRYRESPEAMVMVMPSDRQVAAAGLRSWAEQLGLEV
jgi:tetratricopeptide (TPR) repeat protein